MIENGDIVFIGSVYLVVYDLSNIKRKKKAVCANMYAYSESEDKLCK